LSESILDFEQGHLIHEKLESVNFLLWLKISIRFRKFEKQQLLQFIGAEFLFEISLSFPITH